MTSRALALPLLRTRLQAAVRRGRACRPANRTVQTMTKPPPGRLMRSVTVVRLTLVVGWLAMVALLSGLAVILDRTLS